LNQVLLTIGSKTEDMDGRLSESFAGLRLWEKQQQKQEDPEARLAAAARHGD